MNNASSSIRMSAMKENIDRCCCSLVTFVVWSSPPRVSRVPRTVAPSQDMRIWSVDTEDLDSVVCHNKKLVSGSSAGYLRDTRDMFQKHIFAKGRSWPTVMMAPAYLEEDEESRNLSIEVNDGGRNECSSTLFFFLDR